MIGALAGDIIGSVYEWHNIKTTEFPLFSDNCFFTDDSVLTVALADTLLHGGDYPDVMVEYFNRYPDAGYGGRFASWASHTDRQPYNSYGNGSAMRISPVGFAFNTLDLVLEKARIFTECTHNHPEGIKGAQAAAAAIFLARSGESKDVIRTYLSLTFHYDLSQTLDEIRPDYEYDVTCQGTVPQAVIAFLESNNFEDAIRKAISLGGDSDTLACITGSIAQAFYGVPPEVEEKVYHFLDEPLAAITREFSGKYCRVKKE
jgi:ADP-ribosylglycohydrolase